MHHGTEILVKKYLSDVNESLIFISQQDYLSAKKLLKNNPVKSVAFGYFDKDKQNVFNIPIKKRKKLDLRTVGLLQALDRVHFLCDVDVSVEIKSALENLNEYRNTLTHYTLQLETQEVEKLVLELKASFNLILDFLETLLPGTMVKIDEERFEISQAEWKEYQEDMQAFYTERAMSDLSVDDLY